MSFDGLGASRNTEQHCTRKDANLAALVNRDRLLILALIDVAWRVFGDVRERWGVGSGDDGRNDRGSD